MDTGAGRRLRGGPGQFFALTAARLKDWAAHQFHLAEEVGPGITRDAALRQAAKTTGRQITDEPPPPPSCLAHLWGWFTTLLTVYAEGPTPGPAVIRKDIEARFGLSPTVFEIGLLLDLFAACRRTALNEQQGQG